MQKKIVCPNLWLLNMQLKTCTLLTFLFVFVIILCGHITLHNNFLAVLLSCKEMLLKCLFNVRTLVLIHEFVLHQLKIQTLINQLLPHYQIRFNPNTSNKLSALLFKAWYTGYPRFLHSNWTKGIMWYKVYKGFPSCPKLAKGTYWSKGYNGYLVVQGVQREPGGPRYTKDT